MTLPGYDQAQLSAVEAQDGYRCERCGKIFYEFGVDIFECACGTNVCSNCTVDEGNEFCSDECITRDE